MPTWIGIEKELVAITPLGEPLRFDQVRRKYLSATAARMRRNVILYSTKFTQHDPNVHPGLISIVDEDLQGIKEVADDLDGDKALDLILHSPGGSPEATKTIVRYLRSKFKYIRVVVPHLAMSAATMMACAANTILMGKDSYLGPIDPQLFLVTPLGVRMVPAQAILEQFDFAVKECQDPKKLPAWLPMLGQYGPDLLIQCQHVCDMAKELVAEWLDEYMLKDDPKSDEKAKIIATWLSDHKHFKTHDHHISRDVLKANHLRIDNLEENPEEKDLFLSVFFAAEHTFNGSPVVKIIESHIGKAYMKAIRVQGAQVKPPSQVSTPSPSSPT